MNRRQEYENGKKIKKLPPLAAKRRIYGKCMNLKLDSKNENLSLREKKRTFAFKKNRSQFPPSENYSQKKFSIERKNISDERKNISVKKKNFPIGKNEKWQPSSFYIPVKMRGAKAPLSFICNREKSIASFDPLANFSKKNFSEKKVVNFGLKRSNEKRHKSRSRKEWKKFQFFHRSRKGGNFTDRDVKPRQAEIDKMYMYL